MPVVAYVPLLFDDSPKCSAVHLPALFLDCLVAGDPALADKLRDAPPPRPYTLSDFYRRDGTWTWRVALLCDDLLEPWLNGLQSLGTLPTSDGSVPVNVDDVTTEQVEYRTILDQAVADHHIRLHFISPTSFSTGILTYPLPDPLVLFQSWSGRWNAFSPFKLARVLLDVAAVHVAISYCVIRTRVMDLGVGREVGFMGRVNLRVVQAHRLGNEVLCHLAALAEYARFCGTGQRTAQGMGQTRRYTGTRNASDGE